MEIKNNDNINYFILKMLAGQVTLCSEPVEKSLVSIPALHGFQLSQMKETIAVVSLIVSPNQWCCVVQWERFKDGCCHGLATKDSLRYSMIIAQCVCCYDPHLLTNQYKYDKALKHTPAYLKLLSLPLPPRPRLLTNQ